MSSKDDKYWKEYDGLQYAKHRLLQSYLAAWFPILSSWQGRVLYIDCHAGRGRHETGDEGSPILALRILNEHRSRDQILSNTEVVFYFFEIDQRNYQLLRDEIDALGSLPDKMVILPFQSDYEAHLRTAFGDLRSSGGQLAPSFAFVDPYGFSISMEFLNEILSFPGTELLINFMYRYVSMAMTHEDQVENMNMLFGNEQWKALPTIQDPSDRSDATIKLFSQALNAKYATPMYMRAENGALKYALIHATNHPRGREKIKETMWGVIPDGTFSASEKDSPHQPVLLVPEPDLLPLESAIWQEFSGRSADVNQMHEWLVDQLYLPKHLHAILRSYRRQGVVEVSGYDPPFAFGKNPVFSFPCKKPGS